MRVIAINSSPKMNEGSTALILNPFLEGMKEAGAEVELFYTKKLEINPCLGEFNCWLKTPGKCFQNDDMETLISKLADADIWVFATPLYWDGMAGSMKNLIDRMLPLVLPFLELRDGHCRHPMREETQNGKIVLISNCAYWETDSFFPLLTHMKAIAKNTDREFAGALLRPHAMGIRRAVEGGMPLKAIQDIFDAAKAAGHQLVTVGRISAETLDIVSRQVLTLEQTVQGANQYVQQTLKPINEK